MRSDIEDSDQEAELSQKANSNANATLGSSRHGLARPIRIKPGEIVNPTELLSIDGKAKSDRDDVSEILEESEESQQVLSASNSEAEILPDVSEKLVTPASSVYDSSHNKSGDMARNLEFADVAMISSDKSELEEHEPDQQDVQKVEVIIEEIKEDAR